MNSPKLIFKKTHEINKERFAELLTLAKGKYRSMRTFAAECGADPSTFTRITQGAIKRACSTKLICAIAACADPASGVTMEMLADANGYSIQEEDSSELVCAKIPRGSSHTSHERITRDILIEELLGRNHSCEILPSRSFPAGARKVKPDIIMKTAAFGNQDEMWVIQCLVGRGPSDLEWGEASMWRLIDIGNRLGVFALMMFELTKSNTTPTRFSVVVYDRATYNDVVRTYCKWSVPANISIILVDIGNGVIEDEFICTYDDLNKPTSILNA